MNMEGEREIFDKDKNIPGEAKKWNEKGDTLLKQDEYEEAIECFDKALEISPEFIKPWYNKGVALNGLEKPEEALICLDKALELSPKFLNAWYQKAGILGKEENYEEALICIDKVLEINPDFYQAWYTKAHYLASMDRFEEAVLCLDKALEINPDFTDAKNKKELFLSCIKKDYTENSPVYKCIQELEKISKAIETYKEDNEGQYPDSLEVLTDSGNKKYLENKPICPVCKKDYIYEKTDEKNYTLKCSETHDTGLSEKGRPTCQSGQIIIEKIYEK